MTDFDCPYCGKGLDVDHDEGPYEEDTSYEQECEYCLKSFIYTVFVSHTGTSRKADCLNCSPHTWQSVLALPSFERYSVCDLERKVHV